MDKRCSICGCAYDTFAFKGGYVCESCLHYLKDSYQPDSKAKSNR